MNHSYKVAATAALLFIGSTAMAHPGFVNGGGVGYTWKNNTPAGVGVTATPTARGYNVEGIRIAHGCENGKFLADGTTADRDPVVAASWIWPQGKGQLVDPLTGKIRDDGMAPLSTGCDTSGANCTGADSQPSVARIKDSSKKPSDASGLGVGVATTLASELVGGNTSCTTDPTTHVQTCNSTPDNTKPITTLGGRMQFLGNVGYFTANRDSSVGGGGFWAAGNKFTKDQIAAMGVGSVGAPYQNAIQVRWAETADTSKVAPLWFSSTSCARKLVVRLAGADVCHMDTSRAAVNGDGHHANFWMGGPTAKFTNGHGVHENFWLGYTLTVRDATKNPYPDSCTDKVNGDYDLVVMPTKAEIDAGIPFPGFATKP